MISIVLVAKRLAQAWLLDQMLDVLMVRHQAKCQEIRSVVEMPMMAHMYAVHPTDSA